MTARRRAKAPVGPSAPINPAERCKNQGGAVGHYGECLRCGADNAEVCRTNDLMVRGKL